MRMLAGAFLALAALTVGCADGGGNIDPAVSAGPRRTARPTARTSLLHNATPVAYDSG